MKKKREFLCLLLSLLILTAIGFSLALFAAEDQPHPSADKIYLSDLKYVSYKIEGDYKPWLDDDTSGNGKINLSDIMSFDKGVRTHPGVDYPAEVVYNLTGLNAYRFCSYIGPDANGITGKIQFEVYVDGVRKYISPLMSYGDYEYIEIDVTGAKQLKIVENDGGDGYSYDGGSWADAALYCVQTEGSIALLAPTAKNVIGNELTVSGMAKADKVAIYVNDKKAAEVAPDGIDWTAVVSLAGIEHNTDLTLRVDSVVGGEVKKSVTQTYRYNPVQALLTELAPAPVGSTKVLTNMSEAGSLTLGAYPISSGVEFTAPATGTDPIEGGFTVSLAGSAYTYYEGFASLNHTAASPSSSAVFVLYADGAEIYRSDKITVGNAAYIRATIPAGTAQLQFAAVSGDASKQTVNWTDGTFYKTAAEAAQTRLPLSDGTSPSTIALNDVYQQINTDAPISGITLYTTSPVSGSMTVTAYPFARNVFRSLQESAAGQSKLIFEIAENTYFIYFPTPIPAGEYILTFDCKSSITVPVSKSGDMAYYTMTASSKGAIGAELHVTEQEGKLLTCEATKVPTAVGNYATADEKKKAETAYRGYMKNLSTFPISFTIGDTDYKGFNSDFKQVSQTVEVDKNNAEIEHTTTVMLHTASGIEFTIYSEFYANYAAYEWVVYLKNTSNSRSAIISNLKALDMTLSGADPFIHTSYGDSQQFLPNKRALNGKLTFAPQGGRSTQGAFPYYNVEYGTGGMLMALGWSGQWECTFDNSADPNKTRITAGQQSFNAFLKADETIRTPMVAMVFYDGNDLDRAANLWRHWFIDCSMHRVVNEKTGELELFSPGVSGGTSVQFAEMTLATDANQIEAIRQYIANGIDIKYWWMDAGWYYDTEGKTLGSGNWMPTGSWQVDESRFPSLMADISNYGSSVGVKTLLWFEPERVGGTVKNDGSTVKSDWILGGYLVDEGNIEARDWIVNRILDVMGNGKISLYREDFNCLPLSAWNSGDAKLGRNRTGITENLYVQGHLYIWDKILEAYPSVMIDSCASGGYRNDLEALRRSIQLHKTDYSYGDSNAQQMYALQMYDWMPYFGTKADTFGATGYADRYFLRTALVSWTVLGYDSIKPIDWDIVRDVVDEHELVDRYNYADYYKLTEYSRDDDAPVAWEFYDPTDKSGYVLVFRRPLAPSDTHIKLKGLDAGTTYHLWLEDRSTHYTMTGAELMKNGITVTIPAARSSDILHIAAEYEERALTPSITQVSKDGTHAGAFLEANGYYEFDIRFNMALRDTVFGAGSAVEDGVVGDYADLISIGGKTLRQLTSTQASNVKASYDAINNILKIYVKKGVAGINPAKSDTTVTISKDLKNHEGIAVGKDIEFSYIAEEETWYKLGVNITSITLTAPVDYVRVGSRLLLTATVSPDDATYHTPEFTVSDKTIATINDEGYLRAKSTGTVTVTATAKDGSGVSTGITIRVIAKDADPNDPVTTAPVDTPPLDTETGADTGSVGTSEPGNPDMLLYGGLIALAAVVAIALIVLALRKGGKHAKVTVIVICIIAVAALIALVIVMLASGGSGNPDETTGGAESTEPQTTAPVTDPPKVGETLLVDLDYDSYRLNGSDQPFYHKIPHSGELFEVNGVEYENGVFINPVGDKEAGYVTYDISEFDYDRFAFMFGKIDVHHGSGDATYLVIYIDDEEVERTSAQRQGQDATLYEIEIPEGAEELRIECYTTGRYPSCSSVIGDPRLYYDGTELEWP